MSNIIAFKPDRSDRAARRGEVTDGAKILFFTGVRYMRSLDHDEAAEIRATVPEAATGRAELALDDAERLQA